MSIALTTMYGLANDTNITLSKVAPAVAIAAMGVLVESAGANNHAARLAWAQKSLVDPTTMAKKMVWGMLGDPNVQAAGIGASDLVIQTSINSLVDSFVNA